MFKKNISILLILMIFLTTFSPIRLKAQVQPNQIAKNESTERDKNSGGSDLRNVFARSYNESPALDAKRMERESLNTAKRAKLSKGQKTGIYLGIAAAAVAVIVIIVVARGGNDNDNCGAVCLGVGLCPPPPPPCNQ